MRIDSRFCLVILASLWLLAAACVHRSLEVRRLSVVSVQRDQATQSTKVTLGFEVWDGNTQLKDLGRESFGIYEDGHPATAKSLAESDTSEIKIPVVLVLDTSLSMYQAHSIAGLKAAAQRFVQEVSASGFEVHVVRFASKVEWTEGNSESSAGKDVRVDGGSGSEPAQ